MGDSFQIYLQGAVRRHVIGQEQLVLIARENQTVIPEAARVPLVAQERREPLVGGFPDHPPRLGPMVPVSPEAVHPVHVPFARHIGHVVPGGVTGEGEVVSVIV